MELTKEEKEALFEEFRSSFQKENKADIETIQQMIQEKLGKIEDVEKVSKEIADKFKAIEKKADPDGWKTGPPLREGMKIETAAAPDPLIFQDESGTEHKALRFEQKMFEGKAEDFSIGKILRAKILGDFTSLNDYESKAAGEGIGALGGFFLGEEVSAKVIDLARNLSCVQAAGAISLPMQSPEMRLVKITGDPTAQFVGENSEISESDWSLEPISLKAMTIGCLVRASLEILEDAANSGTALERAMAAAIALEIDRVALLGDGANEPRGLAHCGGVNAISKGVNGGTLANYDDFSNACEDIADHNGEGNAVIFSPRTFFTLDRLKAASTNQPLVAPQSFQDLKKFKTNQIKNTDTQGTCTTASRAFIGDFTQVLYGIRKNVEIEITRQGGEKTFAKCQALIRARMRLDVAVLRPNWFTIISGIKV